MLRPSVHPPSDTFWLLETILGHSRPLGSELEVFSDGEREILPIP